MKSSILKNRKLDKIERSKAERCRLDERNQSFDVKLTKLKQDFFDGLKEV
jgi:hypothetical protein